MTPRLIAVVGPSGAGKDTLMEAAVARSPHIRLARRTITRPTDAGGERFEGVTPEAFEILLRNRAFALHWQAHGLSYGIGRDQLQGDGIVLFNGSRGGFIAGAGTVCNTGSDCDRRAARGAGSSPVGPGA